MGSLKFRSSRIDTVVAVLLALAVVVGMLVWLYYPVIPRNVLGWVLLFVIGIPTWCCLEWVGERLLAAEVFSRMSRAGRIALAVPIVILFLIVTGYVIHLARGAIGGS